MERYDAYIADWHAFLKQLRIRIGAELDGETAVKASADGANGTLSPDLAKSVSMYMLQRFYLLPYDTSRDFYSQYEARMAAAKEWSENL